MDKNNNKSIVENMSKLHWACRRGMLELDVLLGNFLHEGYADLNPEEKQLFVNLLTCADPEIFAWLMGHETPEDQGLKTITEVIRRHARSRI